MASTMKIVGQFKSTIDIKYTRIIIDFTIITLIAVAIFRNLIFTGEWPGGGDALGWISRAYLFGSDFRWLYVWRPYSFGFNEGINSIDFFLMLIYCVCRDAPTTIKIFMIFTFLTAGFTMYAFAYRYNKCHTAALSGSLIYCLNPWIFSQFTEAHIDILFSYALAPLVFLILDRTLERRTFKNILGLSLILSLLITGFHPECIIIYGFFILIFFISFFLTLLKNKNFRAGSKPLLKVILLVNTLSFLICAFSVLPSIFGVISPYYSASFGYPIEDSMSCSYKNMVDAFTLRAIESWGYKSIIDVYTDLSLPDFPIDILLLLIFASAVGIVFFRLDRFTLFFTFSIILSTFIAKGPYPPYGYVFTWMWFNIPHFAVFRAANRASMMTAFSHSFLVSVLVSILVGQVKKRKHAKIEELYLEAKAKNAKKNGVYHIFISVDILNKAFKRLNKFLYCLTLLLLIFIFLSGFLSCYYFFSQGLQVYTPPKDYLEPYLWIANQTGDYKVITISKGSEEWEELPYPKSDFAFGGMKTSIGWGHDIGYDSSFIHDKPTLQDGGWDPSSRAFIYYLRFRVVRHYLTEGFLKLLGPFNYKYIVLPEYLTNSTRDFFLQQRGYKVVYNKNTIILQNDYYTPRFFVPSRAMCVIGGLESFTSLCKIESFNINHTALFFLTQIEDLESPLNILNISEALIFVNSDITDLVMLSLKNSQNFIRAAEYGVLSLNYSKYWARSSSWNEVGGFTWGGATLTTCGKNSINIPFKINSEGIYDLWIRVGFSDNRGKLSILIDGTRIGELKPISNFWSRLMWINITSLHLKDGEHIITFKNDGTGYNDIDYIAIIKPDEFQSKMSSLLKFIEAFSGRIIYILEAENTFTFNLPDNWEIAFKPYQGFYLNMKYPGANVAPSGVATASSSGTWDVTLHPNLANDGNPNTRWASKPHEAMPQWLMIEWNTSKKISGIRILFERALAENYIIQTWNGTEWIDQENVEGNTMLERMHIFKEPVETSKIRILITNVTKLYDLVSIWELEVYTSPQALSTKIFIPKGGNYVFALRLIKDQNSGTPQLIVDNKTINLKQLNHIEDIQWYQSDPINLNVGEHIIEITALPSEKISLDQLFIYSLKNGEEQTTIKNLFNNEKNINISYYKINPCEYRVHIENNKPSILVFSESYHPLWKGYIKGEEISSIPVYSMVNSFYIKNTGSSDIELRFIGQGYADIGMRISLSTLLIVVSLIIIPEKTLENLKRRVFRKLSQR
jgi:hypothetical protein